MDRRSERLLLQRYGAVYKRARVCLSRRRNNFLAFYWPNYEAAPWHLQATFYITSEEETELNFWPHKSKGQFKYEKAIEPMSAFFAELSKR